MTRSWIRRATIAGAVAALVGTFAMAEYDSVLTGMTQSREHARAGRCLVIKNVNSPYVGPPGQLPDEPDPPKQAAMGISVGASKDAATGASISGDRGGSVGIIAAASPQTRLEKSLKDLARELR